MAIRQTTLCVPTSRTESTAERFGGKGRMRGVLSVEIIVLAPLAPVRFIRGRDLQNFDTGILHGAQQPGAIGACGLNANAPELSEGPHPGEHLPISLSGCRKAPGPENAVELVDNSGDVKILVRVDPADNGM